MLEGIARLMKFLSGPLIFLNTIGWIVAGIVLAVLGYWDELLAGIGIGLLGTFLLGILMLLGIVFGGPGMYFDRRGYTTLRSLFVLLSLLYTETVLAAWCLAILVGFVQHADSFVSLLALLVWSYGVATAPIFFLAEKDAGNEFSMLSVFFAQIAFVLAILATILVGFLPLFISGIFVLTMLTGAVVQYWVVHQMEREMQKTLVG